MPSPSPANSPSPFPIRWVVFGVLLVAYLGLYFSADPARLSVFNLLLLPDEILRMWSGGGPLHVTDRLAPTFIALSWIAASWGAGVVVMRVFARLTGDGELTSWERTAFATAVGLATTSHLMLGLGLAGMLHQTTVIGLGIALILGGIAVHRSSGKARRAQESESPAANRFWLRWTLGLATPLVVLLWLAACMPPWEFDVMAYHLQVAKEWHTAGRITFLPHNVYGNMPLGAEMHPLATMFLTPSEPAWFYGAIAGKVILAAYVLLTALGLWLAGRRWLSPVAGLLSALIFLTVPWVFQNGTIGHNEMALACYGFYAWYAVVIWTEHDRAESDSQSWVLLAGWLSGAAAACKYTGVIFLALPLFLAVAAWRGKFNWQAAALMALSGLAAGGLWYVKNVAYTGNPVYPLAYSVFGGENWSESQAKRWRDAHYANGHHPGQLADSVTRVGWRVGGQGAVLMPLALFALSPWGWPRQSPPEPARLRHSNRLRWWLVGLLTFTFLLWWVVTHRLERFLLPSLPWVALLAGGAASQLDRDGWPRRCLVGVLLFAWLTALLPATVTGDFRYLASLEQLRNDLELKRIHPTHLIINTTDIIPVGKRLLMVGDAQVFNLEKPILYNSCWDRSPLTELVEGKSPQERRQAFRDANISHVFVHWGELQRYHEPGNYGYDPYITPALFQELVEQGVLRETRLPAEQQQTSSTLFEVIFTLPGEGPASS